MKQRLQSFCALSIRRLRQFVCNDTTDYLLGYRATSIKYLHCLPFDIEILSDDESPPSAKADDPERRIRASRILRALAAETTQHCRLIVFVAQD